jgi:exopolyphosphatase/guanosine-5'-triphosphate,3'-diphosphate pyrophosphatase
VSKHCAVISIGTNSTRVLLADMAPELPHIDLARSIGTRIGEGLRERGHLGDEPMERTLDAVRQHLRAVRGHYVRLFAIATSALRRADNADDFTQRVTEITGVPVHVITGEEEAAASYRGAVTALGPHHALEVGVADVGGGSTEYAIGNGTTPERTISCEIGAVRLTEAVPALTGREGIVDLDTIERARTVAREALAPLTDFRPIERLVFVGGSATTAAAIVRAKKSKFDRYDVTRADLQRTLVRLCAMPYKERKNILGMKTQRADILPAGIIVLETLLDLASQTHAMASTADLLLGYLLAQRDLHPFPTEHHAPGRTLPVESRR